MGHGACEVCEKACMEAKSKVSALESKIYKMTIVMSVSLTLAGEQVIKNVASYISGFGQAMGAAGALEGEGGPQPDGGSGAAAVEPAAGAGADLGARGLVDGAELAAGGGAGGGAAGGVGQAAPVGLGMGMVSWTDGIGSRAGDGGMATPPAVEVAGGGGSGLTRLLVDTATDLSPPAGAGWLDGVDPMWEEPHTAFLTPSALPFDVYSTTLGLGTNYGFGGFWGVDVGAPAVLPEAPSPGTLSVFGLTGLVHTRRRA